MRYLHHAHVFLAATALWAAAFESHDAAPSSAEAIKGRLASSKSTDREAALGELAALGPAAGPAVPEVAALLDDRDPRVRQEALLCIERIGPAAGAAVARLGKILKDGPGAMTLGAIHALGAIGPEANPTVPDLLRLSDGSDGVLAAAAVAALVHIRPGDKKQLEHVVPVLMKSLASPRVQVRSDAMDALSGLGAPAVSALKAAVEDPADPLLASRAAAVLASMGQAALPARDALLAALKSRNEKLQEQAARALAAIGTAEPESALAAEQALAELLTSKIGAVRASALRALGQMGAAAAHSAPAIAERLKDPDPAVRREAAAALGAIGPKADRTVPALVAALKDQNGTVTLHAATSLGRMGAAAAEPLAALLAREASLRPLIVSILTQLGPDAAPAVPQLVELLKDNIDSSADLVRQVHVALGRIGPAAAPAVPALLATVGDAKSPVRASAVFALVKIGAKDQLLPLAAKTVADKQDEHLRNISAWALVTLDPTNPEYARASLPLLTRGLEDKWALVRWESVIALGGLKEAAEPAVPALVKAFAVEKDPSVRNEIIVALGDIGPAAGAGVPAVLQALADSSARVRYSACYAAGELGEAARPALPVLKKNLNDKDAFLAFVSAWAMANIAPKEIGIADDVLPPLRAALKLPDPHARIEAVHAIAALGREARPALTDLKSLETPDDELRQAVKEAIAAIEG